MVVASVRRELKSKVLNGGNFEMKKSKVEDVGKEK